MTSLRNWIFAAYTVLGMSMIGPRADADLLDQIVADCQARSQAIRSVRYEIEGTVTIPKGSFTNSGVYEGVDQPYPAVDTATPIERTVLIDFEAGTIRAEMHQEVWNTEGKSFKPGFKIIVFDGESIDTLRPVEENSSAEYPVSDAQPELFVSSATDQLNRLFVHVRNRPLFYGHGVVHIGTSDLDASSFFGPAINRDAVTVREANDPDSGVRYIAIRKGASDRYVDYRIDPEKQSAVTRRTDYSRGVIAMDCTIDYSQSEHGWLPTAWSITYYQDEDTLLEQVDCHVVSFEVEPAVHDEAFEITPAASQII